MEKEITAEEKRRCFKLLDEYARPNHNCFVTEFFLSREASAYNVCFRPLGVSKDSPNRYDCKYVQFDLENVRAMASGRSLPTSISDQLDQALSTVTQH